MLSFQNPFGVVNYTLIGDESANTYFEIQSNTGRIQVKQDLFTDDVDFYTVRIPVMFCLILALINKGMRK